ncbi:MAG: DoxX family protein [Elusimicrobia bacterium]|nr:DoxX family protein [Elusimicrobiota bacterium]
MNRVLFLVRVVLGLVFVVSGLEKALSPYENFLYVIQSYDVLPKTLEPGAAFLFPWCELLTGLFVLLGLWTSVGLRMVMLFSTLFLGVVGQAIVRELSITDCGCFGSLVQLPLHAVIFLDASLLIGAAVCLKDLKAARRWSLDGLFARDGK